MSPLNTLIRAFKQPGEEDRGEGPSRLVDSLPETPTELPLWTESDSKETAPLVEDEHKGESLGLPSPFDSEETTHEFEYLKLRLWNQEYAMTRSTIKLALKRTAKSLLLVWKVCPSALLHTCLLTRWHRCEL